MQLGTFRCIEGQKLHAQDILTEQTIPIDILHLSLSITNQILKKSEILLNLLLFQKIVI